MKLFTVIVLAGLLFPSIALGQTRLNSEKPKWVNGFFEERNNSYIEVVTAVGYSEENARNEAVRLISERRSLATGQRVSINIEGDDVQVVGNDALTVKSRIIDQYTEHPSSMEYRVSLLVQTAKNPEYQFEPVSVTDRYNFSPRVFVPGMAQFYKGQTVRGALFITGEIAAIGGIVAFEGLRSSYVAKIHRTHDSDKVMKYIDQADNMRNIRNGFIAGAAVIYAWNVIDGIVTKGKNM